VSKIGRPSLYTPELAVEICHRLSECGSLREVCRSEDMPDEVTVRRWAVEDRGGFSAQYAKAREIAYASLAEELLEIADDGSNDWMERNHGEDAVWVTNGEAVARSRLRVDTRKWLLSKVLPKLYGDKLQVGGDPENPIKHEHGAAAELAAIIDAMAERK
jgi:hypothetical protein